MSSGSKEVPRSGEPGGRAQESSISGQDSTRREILGHLNASRWLGTVGGTARGLQGLRIPGEKHEGNAGRPAIEAFRNAFVDKMDACYQPHIFEPTVLARDNCRFIHHTGDAQHGEGGQKCDYVHD